MIFFRSKVLCAFLALLLVGVNVEHAFADCDAAENPVAACASGEPVHTSDHACHCVCHQTFVNDLTCAPASQGTSLEAEIVFVEQADIPPDAIPLGIDHPPQLA